MSHVVLIKTEIRDLNAVRQACQRLELEQPIHDTFQLFNTRETGYGVQLREWKYPVVCQLKTGAVKYDNFNGRWGDAQRLDEFLQGYAVEVAKLEARKQGFSSTEQLLEDGSIKVTINAGSEA